MSVTTEYVTICGMPTHVVKCGTLSDDKTLFIIIPGLPGLSGFYEEFMSLFHRFSGQPIWGISFAGHVTDPSVKTDQFIRTKSYEVCSLLGQIDHKVEFIRECVPPNTRVVLIGHSIGAYFVLNMLDELKSHRIVHCFLVFPVIEQMANTARGRFSSLWLRYLNKVLTLAAFGLSYLPLVQTKLVQWYFRNLAVPDCVLDTTYHIFDAFHASNIMHCAIHHMDMISELDLNVIERNLDRLSFYYGQNDDWCPREFGLEMVKVFPGADIRMCEKGITHAFVLEHSEEFAQLLWGWICERGIVTTSRDNRPLGDSGGPSQISVDAEGESVSA